MYIFIVWSKDLSQHRKVMVSSLDYAIKRVSHYFEHRNFYYGRIYQFNGEYYERILDYKKEV